jgi:cyclopropane fatty-acyl-phospholipid synthase-like methyltransferase
MIPRYYRVAEREHDLQNPTSREKILLLGQRLRLGAGSRVLDIASGRGGPALLLAGTYGCAIDGIEIEPEFQRVAVERADEAGLGSLLSFRVEDASAADLEAKAYDAALCLGASFVYGGLADTVAALAPAVKPGGHVAVGEPYWRRLPLPADYEERDEPFTTLEGSVMIFETEELPVVSVIASSEDDWDRYETLHWQSIEQWLAENQGDPDAAEIRARSERHKRSYLRHGRKHMGWAIFVGWKRPG